MAGVPPVHTIVFVAGDALKFRFQITDKDPLNPTLPPTPRNLTGWEALSQVRKTPTSSGIEATWTIAPLNNDGVVNMYLSGPETQSFASQNLISDVQLTDPVGDPITVLTLQIQAAQDVTRE
jgi:hypothetical protein